MLRRLCGVVVGLLVAAALAGSGCVSSRNVELAPDGGPDTGSGGSAGSFGGGDGAGASSDTAGAGGEGAGGEIGSGDTGADGIPEGALVVRSVNKRYTDTGIVSQPDVFEEYAIELIVPSAPRHYPITITKPGELYVADVPFEKYYLKFTLPGALPIWIMSDERELDVSAAASGRPDRKEPAPNTKLKLDVSGLNAWAQGDQLEWFSIGAGANYANLELTADTPPQPGESFLDCTVEPDSANVFTRGLVDGAQGDVAYLTQLSPAAPGSGFSLVSLSRVLALRGFQQTDGGSTTVTGTMQAVPLEQLQVDFQFDGFRSAVTNSMPSAQLVNMLFVVKASPGSDVDLGADLLIFATEEQGNASKTFSYGNPFTSFVPFALGSQVFARAGYTASGATPRVIYGEILATFGARNPVSVTALLTPLTRLTVDGQDAGADVILTNTSPRVAWTAPARAERLTLSVLELFNDAGKTGVRLAGTVITESNFSELVLPAGILASGMRYALHASVSFSAGVDRVRQPFRSETPTAWADYLTGTISVQ